MELPHDIYVKITELSEVGNNLADTGDFKNALKMWSMALDLIPSPQSKWEAYTWLKASIGDAEFNLGKFDEAKESFFDALNGPDAQANPFIQFRLGQTLLKLGEEAKGLEKLLRAYALDGEDIFNSVEEGPEYLSKLRENNLI